DYGPGGAAAVLMTGVRTIAMHQPSQRGRQPRNSFNTTSLTSGGGNKGQFQCNYCDFSTKYSTTLARHKTTHTGERPFACPFCPYSAAQKVVLDRHLRRHTGERPYACPHCDFTAARNDNMQMHIKTSHITETSQARNYYCNQPNFE
ncbi:unnamed protein product, partial [Meganyctiphanes norvegica]